MQRQDDFSIGMIYAQCANGGIGYKNKLPWKCRADLIHFWKTVGNFPVIMGHNTYMSAGNYFKSHQCPVYRLDDKDIKCPECLPDINDVERAITHIAHKPHPYGAYWIVGGAKTYAELLPYTHVIVATQIHESFECDTFLPWTGAPEGFVHYDTMELDLYLGDPFATVEIYVNKALDDEQVQAHINALHVNHRFEEKDILKNYRRF